MELAQITRIANRANTTIYTLDPRGLVGLRQNLCEYLRAARAGTLRASVVGALWWDRNRGLDQLPELVERRSSGQAGRFRATSVKMMLDGVAENHTAAMLEPYLDSDGCPTRPMAK